MRVAHNRRVFSANEKSRICKLYLAKESFSYISREFSCSIPTVRRVLEDAGLYERGSFFLSDSDKSKVVQLYATGLTIEEVSLAVGYSAASVGGYLRKHQLQRDRASSCLLSRLRNGLPRSRDTYELRRDMRRLSHVMYKLYAEFIPHTAHLGTCEIDHVYSIAQAVNNPARLRNPINLWEVAHPANLRYIDAATNRRKGSKIGWSAKELRLSINAWNMEHLEPYFLNSGHPVIQRMLYHYEFDNFGNKLFNGNRPERRYYI